MMVSGLIGPRDMKAPLANFKRAEPFVVPPSGKTIRVGYLPYSQSFILEPIVFRISWRSSLLDLSKNKQPQIVEIVPTAGNF